MRSQKEILSKLKEFKESKSDTLGVQWKTLSRKLNWENAKPYINSKYWYDTKEKKKWEVSSSLEEKILKQNLENLMDKAVDDYYAHEYVRDMANIHVFICIIWLFGSSFDKLITEIADIFYTPKFKPNYDTIVIFQLICKEFGLKWSTYEYRYNPNARGKIVLPGEER